MKKSYAYPANPNFLYTSEIRWPKLHGPEAVEGFSCSTQLSVEIYPAHNC